uniref:Palmitoyltransferase n=1 Tax=Nothoprocta perdicaria TaxID=30464 RepID=A0A8C6Z2X0_NOTPE
EPEPAPRPGPFAADAGAWDVVKATQYGLLERCKELVEAGYDVRQPDKENVTLLHWAAINNRQELARFYISKGAVVDQLGGDLNSTPLHWAVRQGHLPMVVLLLKSGADASLIDGEGFSGIHLAVLFQHIPVIAYLISKGQSVDTTDFNGQTPLMISAQKAIGPEPTRFLLKFNPSLNAVDNVRKNTALHWAVTSGNISAVDLLLEAGASMDIRNGKGETPLDLAREAQNHFIVYMLTEEERTRSRKNSRLLRIIEKYEILLLLASSLTLMWVIGYVMDLSSDSWLLKGSLLFLILFGMTLFVRRFVGLRNLRYLPTAFLLSSVKKPLRSIHCLACDACIARYDQHSLWFGQCIGVGNHRYYVSFLFFLSLTGVWLLYGTLLYWSNHCAASYREDGAWTYFTQLVYCSPWVFYIFTLACFHTMWASRLLITQLYQIAFLGLTSYERMNLLMQSKSSKQPISLRRTPYNLGCFQNLADFFQCRCLGMFKPNLIDWTKQYNLHLAKERNLHSV